MLKAYLSTFFLVSKTHIVAQKAHGKQLNAKLCSSKSAIFTLRAHV